MVMTLNKLEILNEIQFNKFIINILLETQKNIEHERIMDIFNYHLEIFHYIKQRNEEKAAQTMYDHIGNDLKHLEDILLMECTI